MLKKQAIYAKGNIGLAFAYLAPSPPPTARFIRSLFFVCKNWEIPALLSLDQPLEKKRTDILLMRPLYNYYSLTQKIKVLADIGSW